MAFDSECGAGVGVLRAVLRALASARTMAERHIENLRGTAAERETAYTELFRLEAEHHAGSSANSGSGPGSGPGPGSGSGSGSLELAGIARAVASPLCEVLCKPVAEVGVAEWQRACQLLTALVGVDPRLVGAELIKPDQCNQWQLMLAPDGVLGAVRAADPSTLSLEDALTASLAYSPLAVLVSTTTGYEAPVEAAGLDLMGFLGAYMPASFMQNVATPSDDVSLALLPLLVELLKAPERLPDFSLRELKSCCSAARRCPLFLLTRQCVSQPAFCNAPCGLSSAAPPSRPRLWSSRSLVCSWTSSARQLRASW